MDLFTYLFCKRSGGGGGGATPIEYNLSADTTNNQIVLTPSRGSAQRVTVPYATDAGTVNGQAVPTLENGKIPSRFLPGYVDDVVEYTSVSEFPAEGELGKLYVDTTTNKVYRWGGSSYFEVGGSNNEVTQSNTSTNANYRLLLSSSADDTTAVGTVGKSSGITYNPSTGSLTVGTRSGSTYGGSSVAIGASNTVEGGSGFAQGYGNFVGGSLSSAFGAQHYVTGQNSSAIGTSNSVTGTHCLAEGYHTTASGLAAHSEGSETNASGDYSHAEGYGTIAQRAYQRVFGLYNIADTEGQNTSAKGQYAEIVGGGTVNSRSNIRTLDWAGNEVIGGNLTVGVGKTITTSDVLLPIDTWDGTHKSLKDSLHQVKQINESNSSADFGILFASAEGSGTTIGNVYKNYNSLIYRPSTKTLRMLGSSSGQTDIQPAYIKLYGTTGNTNITLEDSTTHHKMEINHDDIVLTDSTWDGTNTSLKDTIAGIIQSLNPNT